ncbi:MAG TPA: type II toxin-antitoxin system RelE/ParE family toxin [Nitrososphaerales archaeon]|nr:type II toxin-antitoxin system RelE/ParE family toxin [Nitrososphaerales archaeon]
MAGKVLYKSSMSRDLKKARPRDVERILRRIRDELGENPGAVRPLQGEFKGLFKLRVGDYRVICALSRQEALVPWVGHRGKACG